MKVLLRFDRICRGARRIRDHLFRRPYLVQFALRSTKPDRAGFQSTYGNSRVSDVIRLPGQFRGNSDDRKVAAPAADLFEREGFV